MIYRTRFAQVGALILIALLAARPAVASGAEKPEDVPNPLSASGRYVGDGAAILGPQYIALIDGVCKALQTATSAELAVITVRDLGGTTIEDFAEKLFKRFGIGKKGRDNGILILCALAERDVRVESDGRRLFIATRRLAPVHEIQQFIQRVRQKRKRIDQLFP